MDQYVFAWVCPSKVWYKTAALTKGKVQRQFPNYFCFHLPVLQDPFTKCVNIKLKEYTSHLYFIFYYSKVHYDTQFPKKLWDHGGSNSCEIAGTSNAITELWFSKTRKTKSCRQHELFLWPVKLMLWISNLFLYLIQITSFQKHIDIDFLTDM